MSLEITSKQDAVYLNPTERWNNLSENSVRDLCIKEIAMVALGAACIAGVTISLLPMILFIAVPTAQIATLYMLGAMTLIGCIAEIVWRAGGDWHDYSDKDGVHQDCVDITTKPIEKLIPYEDEHRCQKVLASVRIKNLEKYGVISTNTAKKLQAFKERYVTNKNTIVNIKHKYPAIEKMPSNVFTAKIIEDFKSAQTALKTIKDEWEQFQKEVVEDLPVIQYARTCCV